MPVIYDITPVAKPRMTRRDKWAKRDCVLRYREFKDEVREKSVKINADEPCKVIFHIPMPESWSEKKKKDYEGKPHKQRPDKDNLEKALLDALFLEDSHVWSLWGEKRWSRRGFIEILTFNEMMKERNKL